MSQPAVRLRMPFAEFIARCQLQDDAEALFHVDDDIGDGNDETHWAYALADKAAALAYHAGLADYVSTTNINANYSVIIRTGGGDAYDLGYAAGLADGTAAGYADGYAVGLADGTAAGYADGYAVGYAAGLAAGVPVYPANPAHGSACAVVTIGGLAGLVPHRASSPLFGLVGKLAYTMAEAFTVNADKDFFLQDPLGNWLGPYGTPGGGGAVDLNGRPLGIYYIYAKSTAGLITGGRPHETVTMVIKGVNNAILADVVGATYSSALATTFAAPHVGSTQRAFSVDGAIYSGASPFLTLNSVSVTDPPDGDFGAFFARINQDGAAHIAGTIRTDSAGSAAYPALGGAVPVAQRFSFALLGGIYNPATGTTDPASANCLFSHTPTFHLTPAP